MTFEKRVYEHEFKLNDTDSMIVDYIMKNRENIHSLSIHIIAKELFISPNAIMRMAKKLGYSGFSELKYALQSFQQPDTDQTMESRILAALPQNIMKSLDILDDNAMKELIRLMNESNKIIFSGIGDSVYFCELFGRYLRCFEKRVEFYQQIHDIEYAIHSSNGNFLLITISASGNPDRLVELINIAKNKGASTFCITHYGNNPVSLASDGQLCFWGEKRVVNGYAVTDRSGLMMVVRLVCEQFWRSEHV